MKQIFIKILYFHVLLSGLLFSQTSTTIRKYSYSPLSDSLITNIVSEINLDSIKSYITSLQDFKTRVTIAPNKDSIVNWLINKFNSFGIFDVEIDTCTGLAQGDYNIPTLQKTVVATLKGTVYPDELYVIGGHFDSMNNKDDDPLVSAPGADDNASGVSSMLECARVIMKKEYKPNATIKFVAYDGEELCNPSGSWCFTQNILAQKKKVILAINSDMIANSTLPLNSSTVQIFYNPSDYFFYKVLSEAAAQHVSVLNVKSRTNIVGADNGEFLINNVPTIDFMEDQFNGTLYHSSQDLVENYNMEYCTEVVKITCATLLSSIESNLLPKPIYELTAEPKMYKIELRWTPYTYGESRFYGFNIYRGLTEQGEKTKINSDVIQDTLFVDQTAQNGIYYFYEVRSTDSIGRESIMNLVAKARVISLDQGILVVDETKDGTGIIANPTDEQVDTFYSQLLSNFNKKDFDITKEGYVSISDLGAFSTVLWHGNDDANLLAFKSKTDISKYLEAGGQLLFDSYLPSRTLEGNGLYKVDYQEGDFMYDIFKIKGIERKPNAYFFRANPIDFDYGLLEVDTTKTRSNYYHHLYNIESISAAPSAKQIFTYDTQFDSATTQGSMKGLPVGVEYLGDDYKVITLSFPLYYMQQDQAYALVQNIMLNKFNELTEIENQFVSPLSKKYHLFQNFPNPFNPSTKIQYAISSQQHVMIKVYNVLGNEVETLVNEVKPTGIYEVIVDATNLPSGVYFYKLVANDFVSVKKMMLVK